jgi:hypothetical protein
MTAFRIALVITLFGLSAPLAAQQWGGGGAPSAAKKATAPPAMAPPATAPARATRSSIVDPSLMAAPIPGPSGASAPRASGGGSYGAIRISNWGGSPPAAPARQTTSQTLWASPAAQSVFPSSPWSSPSVQAASSATPSSSPNTQGLSSTVQWSAPAAQWSSPSTVATRGRTTSGRVITASNYVLPADSAQRASPKARKP